MKLVYDKFDSKRNHPYPNLWSKEITDYYDGFDGPYNYNNGKYWLRTCHSEMWTHIGEKNYVISAHFSEQSLIDNSDDYIYPIETYGGASSLVFNEPGEKTSFITNVSETALKLAKLGKLKFCWNYSHEPNLNPDIVIELAKQVESIGLSTSMFLIFPGTSNILELYPEIKSLGFGWYFEDAILNSSAQKVALLKDNPNYHLGYKTTWIQEDEIDIKRNKHFLCPNRNARYKHRYTLGCYFEYKKWWDDIYASFLIPPENDQNSIMLTHNVKFDNNIMKSSKSFRQRIPVEFDTQNVKDKVNWDGGYESSRAFKREVYLDSYIYVGTETCFENEMFITDKPFNGVACLQPFIVFSCVGYLKYIKKLGFKTFDDFIDESYDEISDNGERFVALCNELDRIKNIPLDEIHKWYISIKDRLIYNRNHYLSFGEKVTFRDNLLKAIQND